jgi:hypothetical protein
MCICICIFMCCMYMYYGHRCALHLWFICMCEVVCIAQMCSYVLCMYVSGDACVMCA